MVPCFCIVSPPPSFGASPSGIACTVVKAGRLNKPEAFQPECIEWRTDGRVWLWWELWPSKLCYFTKYEFLCRSIIGGGGGGKRRESPTLWITRPRNKGGNGALSLLSPAQSSQVQSLGKFDTVNPLLLHNWKSVQNKLALSRWKPYFFP